MKINYKPVILLLLSGFFTANAYSQAAAAQPSSELSVSLNTMLMSIALLLLLIILVLSSTLSSAIGLYKVMNKPEKDKGSPDTIKNVVLVTGFMLVTQFAFSQEATTPTASVTTTSVYTYILGSVIVLEMFIIFFFIRAIRILTGINKTAQTTGKPLEYKPQKSLWEIINRLKPIEEEGEIDTGHSYDGIRELDNITPPWFTIGFLATILFAGVYLYRYHIAHSAPLQLEEYSMEMAEAKALQDSLLKEEGNKVDENTIAMLGNEDIASGRKLFTMSCAACHGDKGQGIVGPNLTDKYWLHGGSIKDVFKSIKYGWADKGMKSWKEDFSPVQIAQLASFVKSLDGTNPPGAKEKQGELFVENLPADSSTANIQNP